MTPPGDGAVAVVLVCHDHAADLPATLASVAAELRDGDEVVVVDNASSDGTVAVARAELPAATVVETGANLGFAGGCHAGVDASTAPLVLFLNPDAVLGAGCLEALRRCAAEQPGWGAFQALVTMDGGTAVNTAGNEVHLLGFGWAGALGEPLAAVGSERREVGFASGAAMVVRREAWDALGGFDARYFMYGEDLDLSLRLRLAGWGVGLEPAARVDHDYTFTKGDYKWFYLERNRWWTVLSVYPASLLAVLAPALLLFDLVLLLPAWRGGWLRPKLRSMAAVVRELPQIRARRREVQAARKVGAPAFAAAFTTDLDSPNLAAAQAVPGLVPLQSAVFSLLRRLVR